MNKESKLNLNAGDYAISHCDSDKTYNGLEVHKMLCDAYIAGNNDTLDDVDKDEKIKNKLINLIKMSNEVGGFALHKWEADEMLAWLERQGEHANFRNKIQVGDKVTRNEDGILVNLSQLRRVAKPSEKQCEKKASYTTIVETGDGGINALVTRELPTDGKQKPADTVEPMFKVGDWLVHNERKHIVKVVNRTPLVYEVVNILGYHHTITDTTIENNYHLWTIQDAKDGDVIIDKSGSRECPFIFKETKPSDIKTDMLNPLTVLGYCGIGGAGFTKGSGWGDTANCIYYPATKEQRGLLFQKMNEAGYEWNFKKKDLKKINSYCQENCKGFQETGKCFADGKCKAKREAEQKSIEWSEENKDYYDAIIAKLEVTQEDAALTDNQMDFLKSLRPQRYLIPSEEEIEKAAQEWDSKANFNPF